MDVLHVDNHLLVVFKPAGMPAQADETGDPDLLTTAKAWLKDRFQKPGNVFLGLVHRLDRPASGIMVLARTSKSAARLTEQFKKRTVHKRYFALVEGSLTGSGSWRDHIVKEDRRPRITGAATPGAREARLAWTALATDGRLTLVDVELFTGRPHQIRLQFAHRGLPLLGDLRYGAAAPFDGRNLALHAYSLALTHPTLKQDLGWIRRPPPTWDGRFDDATARQCRGLACDARFRSDGDRENLHGST